MSGGLSHPTCSPKIRVSIGYTVTSQDKTVVRGIVKEINENAGHSRKWSTQFFH